MIKMLEFIMLWNSGEFEFMTLAEDMTNVEYAFNAYEMIYVEEIGYPDALAYEGPKTVIISWWNNEA